MHRSRGRLDPRYETTDPGYATETELELERLPIARADRQHARHTACRRRRTLDENVAAHVLQRFSLAACPVDSARIDYSFLSPLVVMRRSR